MLHSWNEESERRAKFGQRRNFIDGCVRAYLFVDGCAFLLVDSGALLLVDGGTLGFLDGLALLLLHRVALLPVDRVALLLVDGPADVVALGLVEALAGVGRGPHQATALLGRSERVGNGLGYGQEAAYDGNHL